MPPTPPSSWPRARWPGPPSACSCARRQTGPYWKAWAQVMTPPSPARIPGRPTAVNGWRAAGPRLTAVLVAARPDLSLTDDLLIYLVAVVALAVIGGFWPAVLAAASASLLLNWYFTPPLHTFTIDKPDNLLALLLFVTVAVAVSSVVHLAASRAGQAARSREEARMLLTLAQTVLGGADTPAAVLDHLVATLGGQIGRASCR